PSPTANLAGIWKGDPLRPAGAGRSRSPQRKPDARGRGSLRCCSVNWLSRQMKTLLSQWLRLLSTWDFGLHPIHLLILGYCSYIVVGWLVLCLPFTHQDGNGNWLDHLFSAASAVSTTGLVTVITSDT